jgi:hypothetical protein
MEIKEYGKCKVVKLETFQDAQKYGKSTGWPMFVKEEAFNELKAKGDLYLIQDTETKDKIIFQPATKDVESFNKQAKITSEDVLYQKYPELKEAFTEQPKQEEPKPEEKTEEPPKEQPVVTPESTEPQKPVAECKSLSDLYKMIQEQHKRDINSATADAAEHAHPKSSVMYDLESELLGLDPDEVKKLPTKAIEMLATAIRNLLNATEEDPTLRSALRKYVNKVFSNDEECEGEECDVQESMSYTAFLKSLVEAKAQRFNYKNLLEIDPTKITNPFFVQLIQTFELTDITRQQKQGVLIFLKKLAEVASTDNTIANALNRIIRTENKMDQELEQQK